LDPVTAVQGVLRRRGRAMSPAEEPSPAAQKLAVWWEMSGVVDRPSGVMWGKNAQRLSHPGPGEEETRLPHRLSRRLR